MTVDLRNDLDRFYRLLDRLSERVGGRRTLEGCDGRMDWPGRGVYFFFEPGEWRSRPNDAQLRVGRVGTHAVSEGSRTTLWDRLKQHRGVGSADTPPGGGNHRGSIFRRHIGAALLAAGRFRVRVDTWGVGSSAPPDVVAEENELERVVSGYIRRMPFLWLDVDDEPSALSMRGYVERNSISLLSSAVAIDPPSADWLGRNAGDEKIRTSGLWNVRHVGERYGPEFLDVFDGLVSGHRIGSPLPVRNETTPPLPATPRKQAPYPLPAIALVSCTKKKASGSCSAAELYAPSTFFQKAYAYARRVVGSTFILSAKYGLLRPEDVVAPYEKTLVNALRPELRAWAARVHAQLRTTPEYQRARTVVWLAGDSYRSELLPLVRADEKECVIPMEGLAQGQQLAWLSDELRGQRHLSGPAVVKSPQAPVITRRPPSEAPVRSSTAPRAEDFKRELRKLKVTATSSSNSCIEVNAGELHRIVGGYPGTNNRMPVCCRVMRQDMRPGDSVIAQPPKGQGASLTIRYRLA